MVDVLDRIDGWWKRSSTPRCDSTWDFQSPGPQPLWRKTRCSALQRRSSSLTTPSLLSRGSPQSGRDPKGGPARPKRWLA